jgi:hypothetical protein
VPCEGGLGGWVWGWQQVNLHTMSMHTVWAACKVPCLGPHQASRTALLPRQADMSLKPLGAGCHLHFVTQRSKVSDLICRPPKMAGLLVSFRAIQTLCLDNTVSRGT